MRNSELYVDYTKGIAALFVVFCHTWAHMSMENVQLFFFVTHVPAFFLMSGHLYGRYTVHRPAKYRAVKAINLMASFVIYCLILFATRLFLDGMFHIFQISVDVPDLKNELLLDIHRMWYFPVFCISIVTYEMLRRICPRLRAVIIIALVLSDIVLLCVLPSMGKAIVYILVFLIGTVITFDRKQSVTMILLDVFLWIVLVMITNLVTISNESSIGMPLLSIELLLFFGSFFLASVCFLCQGVIARVKWLSTALQYVGKNSQIFYFVHLWVVVVIEYLLQWRGIGEISFAYSIVYSSVAMICAIMIERLTKHSLIMKRLFLKPIG